MVEVLKRFDRRGHVKAIQYTGQDLSKFVNKSVLDSEFIYEATDCFVFVSRAGRSVMQLGHWLVYDEVWFLMGDHEFNNTYKDKI